MTTTTQTPAPGAPAPMDLSGTAPVPMLRLAAVEYRKALDTRAGFWFAFSIVALCLVVLTIFVLAAPDSEKNFEDMMGIAGGVLGYFLPVLIILLVTAESSQRTGVVTFAMEPKRSRIVLAKFLAGIGLAVSVGLFAVGTAVVATLLAAATGASPDWSVDGTLLFNGFVLSNAIVVFTGFAIAMLLMNTPAAIVVYFAYTLILPTVVGILSALSEGFEKVAPWIEFNTAQVPLFTGDFSPTGEEWAQILVAGFIWLVVPLAAGTWRLLRIEFK